MLLPSQISVPEQSMSASFVERDALKLTTQTNITDLDPNSITSICCGFVAQQAVQPSTTRQLSYRKEDRAMRPIYGCTEKF